MGTRNLTMVIDQEGNKKVAQYGQFDGYPSGVGIDVFNFIKNKDLFEKFKLNLPKVRFLESENRDKEFLDSYNNNVNSRPVKTTDEQKKWFDSYCDRELAAKVLVNIATSDDDEIILLDRESAATSSCETIEYCYLINLKENTLGVSRYSDLKPYKTYNLNELPSAETYIEELESTMPNW